MNAKSMLRLQTSVLAIVGSFAASTLISIVLGAFCSGCRQGETAAAMTKAIDDETFVKADHFVTADYDLAVVDLAEEGTVESNEVVCRMTSRQSGESIILRGGTMHAHSRGPDGVTPTAFQGYRFTRGDMSYLILYQSGEFEVVRGESEMLLEQPGTWQD